MAEETASIIINISGGNNQILPNATHAEQHFHNHYSDVVAESDPISVVPDISSRFAIYIGIEEIRSRYIARLASCLSAKEVGRTVVSMVQEVPGLTIDTVKTEPFITILLSLSTGFTRGTTVANFRKAITDAWCDRKE